MERINTWAAAGTILTISIYIHDNGNVELFETAHMPFTSTNLEQDAFQLCLNKHKV